MTQNNQQPETKIFAVYINEKGDMFHRIQGDITQVDFYGICKYVERVLPTKETDDILHVMQKIGQGLSLITNLVDPTKGEECSKESCSGCSHTSDSSQSTETVPDSSSESSSPEDSQ